MSSNSVSSLPLFKFANSQPQTSSASQSQGASSSVIDTQGQRRSGGSGSFGAGSTSRASSSTARNNQPIRKQHKNQRRPRLVDEDTFVESVSPNPIEAVNRGKWRRLRLTKPSAAGCDEVYKQSEGSDLDHTSNELCFAATASASIQPTLQPCA